MMHALTVNRKLSGNPVSREGLLGEKKGLQHRYVQPGPPSARGDSKKSDVVFRAGGSEEKALLKPCSSVVTIEPSCGPFTTTLGAGAPPTSPPCSCLG